MSFSASHPMRKVDMLSHHDAETDSVDPSKSTHSYIYNLISLICVILFLSIILTIFNNTYFPSLIFRLHINSSNSNVSRASLSGRNRSGFVERMMANNKLLMYGINRNIEESDEDVSDGWID